MSEGDLTGARRFRRVPLHKLNDGFSKHAPPVLVLQVEYETWNGRTWVLYWKDATEIDLGREETVIGLSDQAS
jgi:hypothetical protein